MKRFLIVFLFLPISIQAQPNTSITNPQKNDSISREFKELFFEAILHKEMENYDKSITAFLKCLRLNNSSSIVHFELAKNYNALQQFGEAEQYYKNAIRLNPAERWYLDGLYQFYLKQKKPDQAIATLKPLLKFHKDYQNDLINLYFSTENYQQALVILDSLDQSDISIIRDQIRLKIYKEEFAHEAITQFLERRFNQGQDVEKTYLNALYHFCENGHLKKAYFIANQFEKLYYPLNDFVSLALYYFYMQDGAISKGIDALKGVLISEEINLEQKEKVKAHFEQYASKNNLPEEDLIQYELFKNSPNILLSNFENSQLHFKNGDYALALTFVKKAIEEDPYQLNSLQLLGKIYTQNEDYEEALTHCNNSLELYPLQPDLFYYKGKALNGLAQYKKAIQVLEEGLDLIVEDIVQKVMFYEQLVLANERLNNKERQTFYNLKLSKLRPSQ